MDMTENTSMIVDCIPLGLKILNLRKYLFFTWAVLHSVFGRGYTEPPLKYIAEIIGIGITNVLRYYIAFFICFNQHPWCPFHTVFRQIADKRIPCLLFKNGWKVRIGNTQHLTDIIQRNFFVRIMACHIFFCPEYKGLRWFASCADQGFPEQKADINEPFLQRLRLQIQNPYIQISDIPRKIPILTIILYSSPEQPPYQIH